MITKIKETRNQTITYGTDKISVLNQTIICITEEIKSG
jgi:hypothetical protein